MTERLSGQRARTLWGILGVWLVAAPAAAQPARRPAEPRIYAGGGVRLTGPTTLATTDVTETAGGGVRRTVLTATTKLAAAPAANIWVMYRLGGGLGVEVDATLGSPALTTDVTGDIEGVEDSTARETIRQFSFEGGLVWRLPRRPTARWEPFVTGGAGYLRQLHQARTLADTGRLFYGGGGVMIPVRSNINRRGMGIRADARALFVSGGVAFDDAAHGTIAASLSWFVRF